MSDRPLELLAQMATLERIQLHGCPRITDAGVRPWRRCRRSELSVERCRKVTRAGVAAIPPRVRVTYSTI